MVINFATQVYSHTQDTFGRPITIDPRASQPGQPAYVARGIFSTEPVDVLAEGGSIFSDTRTILDILEMEYPVLPLQGDHVDIPAYLSLPELGHFIIIETKPNGGGELSLSLRREVPSKPA